MGEGEGHHVGVRIGALRVQGGDVIGHADGDGVLIGRGALACGLPFRRRSAFRRRLGRVVRRLRPVRIGAFATHHAQNKQDA